MNFKNGETSETALAGWGRKVLKRAEIFVLEGFQDDGCVGDGRVVFFGPVLSFFSESIEFARLGLYRKQY